MRKMSLEETQSIALGVLDELDRFCSEHRITYYLIGGSLIGAVREGDLLSWDDDIDVAMQRSDYDRFLDEYSSGGGYALYSYNRIAGYKHYVTKLVDTRTLFIDPTSESCPFGVFVDIFPLDTCDSVDDPILNRIWNKIRVYSYRYLLSKEGVADSVPKQIVRFLLRFLNARKSHTEALSEIGRCGRFLGESSPKPRSPAPRGTPSC